MDQQHDNIAPAREALAAWDKLFNERETLNGNLDCCNDAAFHQPEGKVPAETVRELATAAILLEQTNSLIEKANERGGSRYAGKTISIAGREFPLKALDVVFGGNEPIDSKAVLASFDAIQARCAELTPQDCATRLRAFNTMLPKALRQGCMRMDTPSRKRGRGKVSGTF